MGMQDAGSFSHDADHCEELYPRQPTYSHIMNSWGPSAMIRVAPPGASRQWEEAETTGDRHMYEELAGRGEMSWRCGEAGAVPHMLTEANNWTTEGPVDPAQEAAAAQHPILLRQQQKRGEWVWSSDNTSRTAPSLAKEFNGVGAPDALSLLNHLQGEVYQLKLQQQLQQEQQKHWQLQQQLLRQQGQPAARFRRKSPHGYLADEGRRSIVAPLVDRQERAPRGGCICNCFE
ncbi:uncharacterized protein EMH_0008630 [Eimeria mitis]|uniref:Uncharacterized protein n=1 Tax=Eimeria mitis TaxID=44415 RepID=U6K4N7_9EIME|nr:uncharacterized protein EMH_0008630 [Eimeria mitis]CDJ31297.1 hypothetical protein, conserved [Eimeria mitis]